MSDTSDPTPNVVAPEDLPDAVFPSATGLVDGPSGDETDGETDEDNDDPAVTGVQDGD